MKKKKARSGKQLKPAAPPLQPSIQLNDLEEFQAAFGDEWLRTVESPAFRAGMQLLDLRKLKSITDLTPEQIENNGRSILSDLKGYLQHENDLLTLHTKQDFKLPFEEPEVYYSPEQVAEMEQLQEKFREQQKKARYG